MTEILNLIPDNKALIAYFGVCNDQLTDKLIGLVKNNNEIDSQEKKIKKRVPFLIAECFQNIIRHKTLPEDAEHSSGHEFFQVLFDNDLINISSSNLIKNSQIEGVKNQLDAINESSPEDLKALRLKIMREDELSNKGGAGLGLIEMARKSSLPLRNLFIPHSKDLSHFFLSLEIPMRDQEVSEEDIYSGDQLKEDFLNYQKNNVVLIYSGDFSDDTSKMIIDMFQENLENNDTLSRTDSISISSLIQIIQNSTQHGLPVEGENEGKIVIYRDGADLMLQCSNLATSEQCNLLDVNLSELKAIEIEALADLEQSSLEEKYGSGLVEIAMNTKNKFTHSFRSHTDDISEFCIEVQLN
ncbi:MAG: SiaB family protein kinase [Crocinitomicaceae bacterium]|nr:SiaB family protein kinase [Crocinitomicaceae bacterium]